MRLCLACRNLVHDKNRTAVAVAGVALAAVLEFMQLGFLHAVESTATLIHDHLDFDLLLVSADYANVYRPNSFPQERLYQAQSHAGVTSAVPVYVGIDLWRNPLAPQRRRAILILACRPTDPAVKIVEVQEGQVRLQEQDTVLFDRLSRPEFGSPSGPLGEGAQTELGTKRIRVVGQFSLGRTFGADGLLIMSDATYARVLGAGRLDRVCLGLLKVRPGVPPEDVAAALRPLLPADVRVHTRAQINAQERSYWVENTATGIIFRFGVIVAVLVGAVFVYQVITSDIRNRLRQYATLKAMGFAPAYLSAVVLQQAMLLAVPAALLALFIALGLYQLTLAWTGIPLTMTVARLLGVFALTLTMCAVSGILALHKVKAAEPADLF